ncbi:hypothetical protein BGX28_002125 [Mortierella sp. GBA30]|nr:hypothetical protein BGX28_002125 [Mortierella sp. GBA30]
MRIFAVLRPLRFALGLLAFSNFMILATALRFSSSMDEVSSIDFMDFQQIVINGCLFLACLYSFFGRATWSPTYRLTMIWIISVLSLIYSISLLVKIQNKGGCSSAFFTGVSQRCMTQYVISGIEMLWTVLLLIEGFITHRQSKDQDWLNRVLMEEAARAQANAVHYQPDLSLYGPDGPGQPEYGRDVNGGGSMHTGPSAVEMEPLPLYMPRAHKDQPQIIDMANQSVPPSQEQVPTYFAPPTSPSTAGLVYASGLNVSHSSSSSSPSPAGPSTETRGSAGSATVVATPASISITQPAPTPPAAAAAASSGPPSYVP